MSVAYLVSRFPHVSETFIVRELDGVAGEGVDVELRSLFPPVDTTIHPEAAAWVPSLRRPSIPAALVALLWWLVRRPGALLASIASVVSGYRHRPGLLMRALATVPLAAAHAREIAKAGRVSHVHAHYATYPALAAWVIRRLTGVPYSFTAHAHDLYVDQSMLGRKAGDAEWVAAISDFNRRFLEPYADGTEVEVVHCGVDPSVLEYRERSVPADGPVRALCIASLQEYKGHAVLLDALRALSRVEIDLVGGGELREALEARVEELGLGERVRFHGPLPAPEVAKLLDAADLFVLPSVVASDGQMEGIPVAVMEAMACGLPVVTTRLSGIPELVRDGETGLLAEPGDPVSLAAKMWEVVAEPGAARVRAQAARRLVEDEFDLRDSARRMAALLRTTSR